ncbi:MAG: SDR family oxidoreductase [Myxococcales bacterium]|nr:SDR family oxidoreductase [Myxococcales bacterium]
MASYLVTGGAGFIGSNLVEVLLRRGDDVRVLDDLSTGRMENLAPFVEQIKMIEGSLVDPAVCRRAVDGVEFILHHGALPSVPKSMKEPIKTHQINVNGTLGLLMAAKEARVRRIVYAASSSAYGDTPVLPKVESMTAQPLSPYAVQKYVGEMYCRVFYERFGLETIALRYFNIFGPRQDPNSTYSAVIPKFIAACLRDEAPLINGDGSISRDFTFIDNVVQANIKACVASSEAVGKVFNIACGERISLLELAQTIQQIIGRGKPPQHKPPREGDVQHSLADISKAKALLGYEPTVQFAEGLRRTISYYEETIS